MKNNFKLFLILDYVVRFWMGYILISNSVVGLITPLEDLHLPPHIHQIIQGMWDTGFMMHLVKATELIVGLMLIFNIFLPLALIAIVPIVINIYGIHVFLFHAYFTDGLYMLLVCLFLSYRHKKIFEPLFNMRS